jgi:hypothetical protein
MLQRTLGMLSTRYPLVEAVVAEPLVAVVAVVLEHNHYLLRHIHRIQRSNHSKVRM